MNTICMGIFNSAGNSKSRIMNMITRKSFAFFLTLLISFFSYGQNDSLDNKYFSIGDKTSGICFGNSSRYNGLRLNLWDKAKNVGEIDSGKMNGINISFSVESKMSNGIQIGGLASHTHTINGVSIASIYHNANKINGIATSFGINCDTLNGLFVGFGVAASDPKWPNKVINGFAAGVFAVGAERVNGATFCFMWSYSREHYGLSIAAVNETDNLHGLQIGLLNYAGNNPKLLRWIPLINFHP